MKHKPPDGNLVPHKVYKETLSSVLSSDSNSLQTWENTSCVSIRAQKSEGKQKPMEVTKEGSGIKSSSLIAKF